jgi:hypothetical protein
METDLDQGERRYDALKKNYFTVMYDREGANGLSLTFNQIKHCLLNLKETKP